MSTVCGYLQLFGLGLFLAIFLGKTLHLRIKQRITAVSFAGSGPVKWKLSALFLFITVNAWATEVVFYSLPTAFRLFPYPFDLRLIQWLPLQLAGMVLIVSGLGIFIQAMRDLGDSWRLGIDELSPGGLVTGGIYRVSRHPIYLFFDLYFLGTFLVNGALIFLVFFVVIAVTLHMQMLQEEGFLTRVYGTSYQEYCARTNRYLGLRRGPVRGKTRLSIPGE